MAFEFGGIKIKINLQKLSAGNSAGDLLGMVVCDPFKGCWPKGMQVFCILERKKLMIVLKDMLSYSPRQVYFQIYLLS